MTGIDLDLAGIRARAEAATPGPWFVTGDPWFCSADGVIAGSPDGNIGFLVADCEPFGCDRNEYEGPFKPATGEDDAAHIASADPPTVIAMLDLIERQAGEIARLKAEKDTLETRGLQLAEALKPFANSAAQWTHARSYDDRLQGLRCSVGCVEFDRALIAMAGQSVNAALTPKEDTPCRTA